MDQPLLSYRHVLGSLVEQRLELEFGGHIREHLLHVADFPTGDLAGPRELTHVE